MTVAYQKEKSRVSTLEKRIHVFYILYKELTSKGKDNEKKSTDETVLDGKGDMKALKEKLSQVTIYNIDS